ncbi:MAG: ABC transporter substrate-binding protein, partial [Candidatus Limnocylindrales bacterium]
SPLESPLSRRTVLKGAVGVAGLASVPALIAACGPGAATPTTAPASTGPTTAPASAAAGGSLTLGSNLSDAVPKKALQDIVDAFTKSTSITVKINTVDHSTFQDQLSSYLQATPDDVFTWFSGYRMRFFAGQGLATDISDVWAKVGSKYTDAFKVASTGDDTKQYFVPFVTYAWTVYYRKSVFADKSYTIPTTLDEFKTLAAKMQSDGLAPIGLGQQDGWPAMGHFDIIDLRENGYQFHVDLMAGKQKWTDAKVKQVFTVWKGLLPYYQTGSAGRKWEDAAAGLVQKKTGMMLQPQVGETFAAAGEADFADLDFFPWPNHGTEWDAEKALDAPIDGFMISSKSPNLAKDLDAAKAFVEFVGQGSSQAIYAKANPSLIGTANDVDTSGYTALQKRQAEVIAGAQKLTQFLDRDTDPRFAGKNGMQHFLTDFIQNPDQDLDAFLKQIQAFWDSLGPVS